LIHVRTQTAEFSDPISSAGGPTIITIDGPAASGKSTIGHAVADALNYLFFDTGVMYRAVTRAALDRDVDVHDADAMARLAETIDIDIVPPTPEQADGRQSTILVAGEDVTWGIRAPEVDQNVSIVAANPRVRQALSAKQRAIGKRYGSGQAEKPGIVMVGRDIGTVVLPEAGLKIYMDASAEERARRRLRDLEVRGKAVDYEQVLADIIARDRMDSERDHSPLRPADDAVIIDTSRMTPDEVVDAVVGLVRQANS
jgi:cytidylate kinase